MTTKRQKGSQMEKQCLEQFLFHMSNKKGYQLVATWISHPSRFQSQDLYGSWDWAAVFNYNNIQIEYRGQVKSEFSPKYYKSLQDKWKNSMCKNYLCIYDKKWQGKVKSQLRPDFIKLPGFRLVRV